MNTYRKLFAALILAVLLLAAHGVSASADDGNDELSQEIERQLGELDTSAWDEYVEDLKGFIEPDFDSFDELLTGLSERGDISSSSGLFVILKRIAEERFKAALVPTAVLTVTALLTALSGIVSDEGLKKTLGIMLSASAVLSVAGMLASLAGTAYSAVEDTARLSENTTPIMSALLISVGSETSAAVFTPQFAFLSETVTLAVSRTVLPLTAAQGVIAAADAVSDSAKLGGIQKLIGKLIRWTLGILSTVYVGMTAVRGLTAASRDGVAIRTAKFAIDKLVPIAGGMVSGTADSILGSALLLRNGVGTAAILILISRIIEPAAVLLSGVFVFRAAEALCSPAADERAVRLLSNAADCAANLFTCTAVTGALYVLTVFMIMASGGIAAGLW